MTHARFDMENTSRLPFVPGTKIELSTYVRTTLSSLDRTEPNPGLRFRWDGLRRVGEAKTQEARFREVLMPTALPPRTSWLQCSSGKKSKYPRTHKPRYRRTPRKPASFASDLFPQIDESEPSAKQLWQRQKTRTAGSKKKRALPDPPQPPKFSPTATIY